MHKKDLAQHFIIRFAFEIILFYLFSEKKCGRILKNKN